MKEHAGTALRRGRPRHAHRSLQLALSLTCLALVLLAAAATQADRLTPQEESARLDRLRQQMAAEGRSFKIGHNHLTDIPWEEFQQQYLGLRLPPGFEPRPIIDDHGINDQDLPAQWDWREHGGVSGVRNQASCGSCWSFSASGALEAQIMLTEGLEVDLSEQHVLACNPAGSGCGGGWMQDAYALWQDYGAITEEDMPYEAIDTLPCPGSSYPAVAKMSGWHDVGWSVSEIKQAIYDHGPVSVTMMVYEDFQAYESGCYFNVCNSSLNHAVLLVGWDDSFCDGQGAWILKNSWSEDWGIDGYAHIRYDAACVGNYANYVDYLPLGIDLLGLAHTPLDNTEDILNPYEILAEIVSNMSSIDTESCYLAYRTDGGAWQQESLVATGVPNVYQAFIPAQPAGTIVDYYLHAADTAGSVKYSPVLAPDEWHSFIVGTFVVILHDDFETDSGWTVGDPSDDATTGIWDWCDPEGTFYGGNPCQSEDDHTEDPGHLCFCTDGRAGSGAGDFDVDGGRTTLLSPVYDLSGYAVVYVEYYRWYTNRLGSNPNEDYFELSVRSGASDWIALEYSRGSAERWIHRSYMLNGEVEIGDEMQFRFVASDEGGGSLVEAMVDDFELRGIFRENLSAADEPVAANWQPALACTPNPFNANTSISFRLTRPGPAKVRVYDLAGRRVRVLFEEHAGSGWHHLQWDGRDGAGHSVASGVYFLRMTSRDQAVTRKILLSR